MNGVGKKCKICLEPVKGHKGTHGAGKCQGVQRGEGRTPLLGHYYQLKCIRVIIAVLIVLLFNVFYYLLLCVYYAALMFIYILRLNFRKLRYST